jgi:endonuclease G
VFCESDFRVKVALLINKPTVIFLGDEFMTVDEFLRALDAAKAAEDIEALEKLGQHFVEGGAADLPFQPDIRLQGMSLDAEDEALKAGMAVANAWARSYRDTQFGKRLREGYTGPIVVSEGASWYQYPWFLKDVIDNLMQPYAVKSLGAAGDTLANMIAHGEYRQAISDQGARFFLFSASGNDVLGGGDLSKLLHRFQTGMELDDVLRGDVVARVLQEIEQGYDLVIREALAARPGLQVFFHGYDRPVPRRGGKWLGRPMEDLGVPRGMQQLITGHLIDLLNARLAHVAARFPGQAHHVDCRGRVGTSVQSWYDELHPRDAGYARVAALFEAQMREAGQTTRIAFPGAAPLAEEAIIAAPIDPRPDTHGATARLLAQVVRHDAEEAVIGDATPDKQLSEDDLRVIAEYEAVKAQKHEPDDLDRVLARRQMVPNDDSLAFERIMGDNNFFPVNYLSRGARMARAVAKLQIFMPGGIPWSSGSGFLVGPGLMLTNHHVIESRDVARRARAIFDFQEDDMFQPMPTKAFQVTGDIFFTSPRDQLDFSFVSVRVDNDTGDTLEEFGQFAMIEESGKAVKGEPVPIIQHPRGDRKTIALRDSKIEGVFDDYIYYSTDTERGSSGAPVLNDQWLPVALHHRSVPHPTKPDTWIANRGIRISRIFARLREAAEAGDMDAVQILRLIGAHDIPPLPQSAPGDNGMRPGEREFIAAAVPDVPGPAVIGTEEAAFATDRWQGVDGYDPDFLDTAIPLPLPQGGAGVREVNGRLDLPYLHFSVVMHADRKLAMVTACNTDGSRLKRLKRTGSWRTDPRIPLDAQVDNAAYRHNDYDRGHLVRRVAPMWGTTDEARFAMADTFHYTVCAPQNARLN